MDNGFDIYMKNEPTTREDYKEFLHSEKFAKYASTMDISIPSGYHFHLDNSVSYTQKGFWQRMIQ